MAFVVAATWKAKLGEEQYVTDIIKLMTRLSREEPGNVLYQAQASLDEPGTFLLYERYVDAAGYDEHKASVYFKKLVLGDVLERLVSREVMTYETIDV